MAADSNSNNLKVVSTGKIDGGAYRIVMLPDGSGRVEQWTVQGWIPGGASFRDVYDAPPVSATTAVRLGIPFEDLQERNSERGTSEGSQFLMVDAPSIFSDTLATWEHYLSEIKRLPDTVMNKQSLIEEAEQVILRKREQVEKPPALPIKDAALTSADRNTKDVPFKLNGIGKYDPVLTRARRNFTAKWSCRQGDYLLWFRRDPFNRPDHDAQILDIWWIPDRASVTLTNRWQDFPPWFDLHPTEVCNSLTGWMRTRLAARDYPEEPIDGLNIWRARGGDRIVWVGPPRMGQLIVDGVLGILDCHSAIAVLGDHPDGLLAFMEFESSPLAERLGAAALNAERSLGCPRVLDTEWQLG